jgi:hypothetical protein
MRRLLWLPVAAALGVLSAGQRAPGQHGDDFGVLKTSPASPANSDRPSPPGLPAGVVPDRSAGPAAAGRPVNPFPVTPDAGTWMICATTYLGPDGVDLARQVTVELRDKHKLKAFIYNRGDEERARQEQEYQERLKQLPPGTQLRRRFYRVQDQYAVLVGGFKDFDAASAYLPTFKKLPAPVLKLDGGKSPYELMTYQEVDPNTKKEVTKAGLVHPFHLAMVVRNPTVPNDAPARPKWDPLWKKLNADEEYSLLNNPKRFSLLVKEYQGIRAVQQQKGSSGFLSALGLGGANPGEALDATARQAHELARFLRHPNHGLKAWVLHTRNSSLVCVGGFDGPDDPEFQRLKQRVAGLRFTPKGGGADPVGLLPDPIPIEIPRP